MTTRLKRLAIALAILGGLVVMFLTAQRIIAVAAVQNSVTRGWEISFNAGDRPAALPVWLDDSSRSIFDWIFRNTHGTTNRQIIHRERFRALFRGPITAIYIADPVEIALPKIGAAFARFPRLRSIGFDEIEPGSFSETKWTLLCAVIRALPQIEQIELHGSEITDAALAPFAGHPFVGSVTISGGRLTANCTRTFSTLPSLSQLTIEATIYEQPGWLTAEERKAFAELLPAVTVVLNPPVESSPPAEVP